MQAADSLEEANRLLKAQGMRAESLGSDALQQWIREANIQEIGGVYYQRTLMPDGKSALIETKPPQAVLDADKVGNAQLSEMMFKTLDGETQALIKKVAFNPEAFILYGWAKRKGYLEKDKDFRDLINYYVILTVGKIFGDRVGARAYLSVEIFCDELEGR